MKKTFAIFALLICKIALLLGYVSTSSSRADTCAPAWKDWDNWKNNPPELIERTEKYTPEKWAMRFIKQREALEKFAPWILDEFKQIDQAMGWPEGFSEKKSCYGVKNKVPPPEHECTSWAAMPDITDTKCVMIHKNRDSSISRLAVYRHQTPGKNAYIGCGAYGSLFPASGVNEKGVAIIMNAGDTTDDVHQYGLSTPQMLRIALECCDNAKDAVALLKKMALAGAYSRPDCGSLWYVADPNTAFVMEMALHRVEYQEIKSGFSIRANEWHFPPMRAISKDGPGMMAYSLRREIAVQKLLMLEAYRKNGVLTQKDVAIASRFRPDTADAKKLFTEKEMQHVIRLCGDRTISGSTFVLDKEFPEVLTTAWIACGHIWHSIYIPYPITLTDFPKPIANGTYADAVFQRFWKYKYKTSLDDTFKIEEEIRQAYNAAVDKARELLRQNRKDEAVKLLNDTFAQNWEKAAAFHKNRDAK